MSNTAAPWAIQAAALPVAFAQVREDPQIDRYLVERLGEGARVCMVASGGCTAAVLAALPNVAQIQLVDPNPAQLALARLKLRMLETADSQDRRVLFGHERIDRRVIASRLPREMAALELGPEVLGPPDLLYALTPDHVGRYEFCFSELQKLIDDTHRRELLAVLSLSDPIEQARRIAPDTSLGRRMDEALDTVMSLPNMVALFGEGATRNPAEPFSRHFARRLRHVFAALPAASNSFLWKMLRGRGAADWFELPRPARMPAISWQQSFMADALRQAAPESFDLVHLSNILDWLSPEEATATLELTSRALRPRGQVMIRQLNSTLDIPASGPMFEWDVRTAAELHATDRSFFYKALHVGRKR